MIAHRVITDSDKDKLLLRYVAKTKKRFENAGIRLPKNIGNWMTPNKGGCAYHYKRRYWFIIPTHAKEATEAYFEYYVIHEMSHIAQRMKYGSEVKPHGLEYYKVFSRVCPKKYWKWEFEYKPSFARHLRTITNGH